jgi:polysaccharide export outer membrane protein
VLGQILNLGDGVRITFFNISESISGDYYVQQDGNIQLPYIGLILGTKRQFEEIKLEIISKYDLIYRDPELTVQPLYKVNILGEVRTPGIYYVTGVEKLVDLIALAGGETSDADIDNLYIIRQEQEIKIDAERIIKEGNQLNDIGLRSGDRIYVPRRWWVSARNAGIIISAAALLVTIVSVFIVR